ncbi:MAG: septal ring lytic transglycosylase RlpA family protein [Magnetococcales bacterium]|nr:septal ring lytic transglycosylase RlpA family protein [Magnetococcales bacterium]
MRKRGFFWLTFRMGGEPPPTPPVKCPFGRFMVRSWLLILLLLPAACGRFPETPEVESQPKKTTTVRKGTSKPYEVFGKTYYPLTEQEAAGYTEEGVASWYGREFHDRPTAIGERFDMFKPTAAHTVLPLPMMVRVTNLDNGRSIELRVNDRGPFIDNRLIDLSFAAAEQLGYAQKGLARVRVEALGMLARAESAEIRRKRPDSPPSPMPRRETVHDTPWKAGGSGKDHYIQVGSFGRYENAQEVERRLRSVGKPKIIKSSIGARIMYRVRLGPFATAEQAERVERAIRKLEIGEAVIIRD